MVEITKKEAMYLVSKGAKFAGRGCEGVLHTSKSRYPKHYLTEDKYWLPKLKEYRAKHTHKVV